MNLSNLLKLSFFTLFFLLNHQLLAQLDEATYLQTNSFVVDTNIYSSTLINELSKNNIVMFGHEHGTSLNQTADLWLMKSLVAQGFKYIVVELNYTYAYFLNEYLKVGDEALLDFVISNGYFWGTPQDASVELRNKWMAFKKYHDTLPPNMKVKIIGGEAQRNVDLVHVSRLVPSFPTGISMIDSLEKYQELVKYRGSSWGYWSTKPIYKGKYKYEDYLQDIAILQFLPKFVKAYQANREPFEAAFGINRAVFKKLMRFSEEKEYLSRSESIYNTFISALSDSLSGGAKVYVSYGFSHVLQEKLSGNSPLGHRLKLSLSDKYKIVSITSMTIDSDHLDAKKYKKGEAVRIKDIELHKKAYAGYSTYSSDDVKELQLSGKKLVSALNVSDSIVIYPLAKTNSPFTENQFFIEALKKAKKYNWFLVNGSSTIDYFQYLLVVKGSKANTPFPKM
ncbi:MAG: hypothetical protein AAFO07_02920 [Bacteroidota bacterium]